MPSNPFEQQPYTTWTPSQSAQWRPAPGQQAPGYQGYYNPNSNYGGTAYQTSGGQFTPFWVGVRYHYLQNNPSAVWSMFTSPFAGGNDPFSVFVRSQQDDMEDAYLGALSMNPDLTRQQFYEGIGYQGLLDRFNQQSAAQRGINQSLYGGGRVQWFDFSQAGWTGGSEEQRSESRKSRLSRTLTRIRTRIEGVSVRIAHFIGVRHNARSI